MMEMESDVEPTEIQKKSTVVTVTAIDAGPPDWVKFSMSANYPNGGGNQAKDDLVFNKKAGEFLLEFKLADRSTRHLSFIPCFKETMWVQRGEECPVGPGDGGGVIAPVSWNKTTLIVNNLNAVGETLTFTLRFDGDKKDASHPPYEYYPRIINGGNT